MNLETRLDTRLWTSIQSSYEKRDFTGAIKDAIYFLSDVIRDKSGLEGDGVALVGQAFGGKIPKLKINKLQTETEQNIQSGVEQLLRGLYQAIRNPRSHEKYSDSQEDADTLILFVNYLLKFIDQSKSLFDKNDFMARVFDPDFPENRQYSRTLVAKIPEKDRFGILIDVFRQKENAEAKRLQVFIASMLEILKPDEVLEFHQIVSEELETTNDEALIRRTIQIMPRESWANYSQLAKIRIENKLIQSIGEGLYLAGQAKCLAGSFGTWANGIHKYFTLKRELVRAITGRLSSNMDPAKDYAFAYFFKSLMDLEPTPSSEVVDTINSGLKAGEKGFYDALLFLLAIADKDDPWKKAFGKAHDDFVEGQQVLPPDDDVPF
jgi:uncharacterized protein (TIGR02391 family)